MVVGLLVATSFAAEKAVSKASGLRGITSSIVKSGLPGGSTMRGPRSVEFAIVPMQGDRPEYQLAIFVKSDMQGKYEVVLPPGRYWIGPEAKVRDPKNYRPNVVTFYEKAVVVQESKFTEVDLLEEGYAS
jgi:hypothetical protein